MSAVDELPQCRRDLAFELVARELHNQQLDGSNGHAALLLNRALGARFVWAASVVIEGQTRAAPSVVRPAY